MRLEMDHVWRRYQVGEKRSDRAAPGGDQHYPVTIDLGGVVPELRPGMSVRITLADQTASQR